MMRCAHCGAEFATGDEVIYDSDLEAYFCDEVCYGYYMRACNGAKVVILGEEVA